MVCTTKIVMILGSTPVEANISEINGVVFLVADDVFIDNKVSTVTSSILRILLVQSSKMLIGVGFAYVHL
jgi:hypothetical protein